MKPPPFAYHRPDTLDEALALLAQHGSAAKVLAGGQSLVPTMNFRLAQPAVLIDVNRLHELAFIESGKRGALRIGALTRQRAAERSDLVTERAPLLHETLPFIAHPQIRNRGTVGGSIAHADPAAELPAMMLVLQARFHVRNARGDHWIDAQDFFTGLFTTALDEGDLLVEIEVPATPDRAGCAFIEISRRHGDYALVGVGAIVALDKKGRCEAVRIGMLSVGDGPVLATQAAAALAGEAPTDDAIAAAADAAGGEIDPPGDIHASADYRRHLARVLTKRVLQRATTRARSDPG